jgi:chloramphenicol 3-O-phosphotransferase
MPYFLTLSLVFLALSVVLGIAYKASSKLWPSRKLKRNIFLVFGASSTGKTSLAKEVINRMYPDSIVLTTGIDEAFKNLGNVTDIICKKEWVDGEVNFTYEKDADGSPLVDLSMGSLGEKLMLNIYNQAGVLADKGFDVIVDEVLLNDSVVEYGLGRLSYHNLYIVCMHAPLSIREQREAARGDRFIGHTRSQEHRSYEYKGHNLLTEELFDVAFDSSQVETADAAQILVEYIKNNPPRAYKKLMKLKPHPSHTSKNQIEAYEAKLHPVKTMERPFAFLIIGASSSGKTVLAQELINHHYPNQIVLATGIDEVFRWLGDDTKPVRRDEWVDGEINYIKGTDVDGKPLAEIRLGALGENLLIAMYEKAQRLLRQGIPLVIDDVLLSSRVFMQTLDILKDYNVYLVCTHAPLEIREEREVRRGDRLVGHTRTQEVAAYRFAGQHLIEQDLCDIAIDTSKGSPKEFVARIIEHARNNPPQALDKLRNLVNKDQSGSLFTSPTAQAAKHQRHIRSN